MYQQLFLDKNIYSGHVQKSRNNNIGSIKDILLQKGNTVSTVFTISSEISFVSKMSFSSLAYISAFVYQ